MRLCKLTQADDGTVTVEVFEYDEKGAMLGQKDYGQVKALPPEVVTLFFGWPDGSASAEAIDLDESEKGDGAEPEKPKNGPLPKDFPHRKELDEAGYGTWAKVRKLVASEKWYEEVPGIGEKTAPDVEEALE